MSLLEKLGADLKESLKSRNEFTSGVLRMVLASIHNREIEKRSKVGEAKLTEEEIVEVLGKEAKKRKEAADIYMKAGRGELAEKEQKELEIIQSYLPEGLTPEEIGKVIDKVIESGAKDFGSVMKSVMAEVKGRAESGVVAQMVKEKLG